MIPTNLFSKGTYDDTNPNGYGLNHATGATSVFNTADRFGNTNTAKYLLGINYLDPEGTLREVLDAGFYAISSHSNTIYFYYKEAYNAGRLAYKVYDQNRMDITARVTLQNVDLANSSNKAYGTNRYKLTLPTMNAGDFYLLEVTNEKGEKEYLRFVKI